MAALKLRVAFTVDLEPDCPPYLWTFRGVEHGMPALLDALASAGVRATFFTTGDVARRYPATVRSLVAAGHELGCHGMSHTAFTRLVPDAAREEIVQSAAILREFAPVTSFRAPYLQFPEAYVPMLRDAAFELDSSQAIYKLAYWRSLVGSGAAAAPVRRHPRRHPAGAPAGRHPEGAPATPRRHPEGAPATEGPTLLTRIPASVTSSVLRLPRPLRTAYLSALSSPVVLFVHPWEFVDLTRERLRLDCRFKTGQPALDCLDDVLRWYARRGAEFLTMRELANSTRVASGTPRAAGAA